MRHHTWQYIIDWVGEMGYRYGGSVYEKDGTHWDWGQALCRETYGKNWMTSEEFNENEKIPPEDPAPERFLSDAKKWETGIHPDWVDVSRFRKS
jgi:hypothetical protein